MKRTYPVAYNIEHGKFTPEELKAQEMGGCDAVIVHSIVYPKDGSRSELILCSGADGKPLDDLEMFKSWVSMAHQLSQSKEIGGEPRELTKLVFEAVRAMIRAESKAMK